ncbi:MAG: RNA polymerase sigma factor [Candidatus Taylorbacteria bacterium]|nr:RNA polymerase sigma factor [Candidatus Taylorbacteria bacterium]
MRANKQNNEFESIFSLHSDALFRHCYLRMHDREEAKDIVQEAFMRYWRYAQSQDVANVKAFLFKTANNLIIDHWRKKKSFSLDELMDNGMEVADESKDLTEFSVATSDIMVMLRTLGDKERDTLVMRYIDDLPVKDIAELLEESENAVSVRIYRALKKLRERFQVDGTDTERSNSKTS